jgi:hypothetical protein
LRCHAMLMSDLEKFISVYKNKIEKIENTVEKF